MEEKIIKKKEAESEVIKVSEEKSFRLFYNNISL